MGRSFNSDFSAQGVPAPSVLALLGLGMFGLTGVLRSRREKVTA